MLQCFSLSSLLMLFALCLCLSLQSSLLLSGLLVGHSNSRRSLTLIALSLQKAPGLLALVACLLKPGMWQHVAVTTFNRECSNIYECTPPEIKTTGVAVSFFHKISAQKLMVPCRDCGLLTGELNQLCVYCRVRNRFWATADEVAHRAP